MQSCSNEDTKKRLLRELETITGRDLDASSMDKPLHELGVDSMSLVELLVAIEREFGIRLIDAGVTSEDLGSIESLAAAIHREQ